MMTRKHFRCARVGKYMVEGRIRVQEVVTNMNWMALDAKANSAGF